MKENKKEIGSVVDLTPIIMIILLMVIGIIWITLTNISHQKDYEISPPCYYHTDESHIRMFGISPYSVSVTIAHSTSNYSESYPIVKNELDNLSEIFECPPELSELLISNKNITKSWVKDNTIEINSSSWKYYNYTINRVS